MKYRRLSLRCACGRRTNRIGDVGFTAGHELVLHWRCSGCKRVMYVVKELSDCWRHCPQPRDAEPVEQPGQLAFGPDDARFLRSLGVTLLADG